MSIQLPVDFSTTDYILYCNHTWQHGSVTQAMKSIYPDKDIENLQINNLLRTIYKLAIHCAKRGESFHNIDKHIKATIYHPVNGLRRFAKKFKLLLFRNDENISVYLYPRPLGKREKRVAKENKHTELFKESRYVIKMDFDLNHRTKSRFRIVTQVFSKILEGTEKLEQCISEFNNEVINLRKFQTKSSFVTLYHYIQHSSRIRSENKRYTKLRLFEERFNMDLRGYHEHYINGNVLHNQSINAFIYLTWALNNLHKKNLFHGAVKPESFLFRQDEKIKKVVLRNLDFTTVLGGKKGTITCTGKPALLSGYESILNMIENNTFTSSIQGLPSDVWALGCTLYHLMMSRYPDVAIFISLSPKLNAMCHLLRMKVNFLSDIGLSTTSGRNSVGESDWSNSDLLRSNSLQLIPAFVKCYSDAKSPVDTPSEHESDEEPIVSFPVFPEPYNESRGSYYETKGPLPRDRYFRLFTSEKPTWIDRIYSINNKREEADALLIQIDSIILGDLCGLSQADLLSKLDRIIESLCNDIQNDLLGESADAALNEPIQDFKTLDQYREICDEIINFNQRLIIMMRESEKALGGERNYDNPLLELIKMMMHPDPTKRITTQKALEFLKKNYHEFYDALLHKNSLKK